MSDAISFEDDLLTEDYFADPYPLFDRMRAEAPIYWSDKLSSWILTRYDDCEWMLNEADTFISSGRVAYLLDQLPDDIRAEMEPIRRHYQVGLAHSDPPIHTRLRKVLMTGINPKMAKARAEGIRQLVTELIERFDPSGEVEFISAFAYPLPATVVADLIGAPREDIGKFKAWADSIAGLFEYGGTVTPAAAQQGLAAIADIRDYIGAMLRRLRTEPGDDLMSMLVHAESAEDGKLNEQELISTAVTLFVAGHETTTNLLGMGLKAMIDRPELQASLRRDPERLKKAVEEFMRHESVVPRGWRMASKTIERRGQTIREGDMVMAMFAAANRDPAIFGEPSLIQVDRANAVSKHMGFGRGIHFCIGRPLAQTEAVIAFQELLKRFGSIGYGEGDIGWRHDMALRGLTSLPVKFSA